MRNGNLLVSLFGAAILGAILTAISISFSLSRNKPFIFISESSSNFNDFSGLLLSCISVIVTVFGVVLAVLAIFGFSVIQERATQSAAEAGKRVVEDSLKEGGGLYKIAKEATDEIMYRGIGIAESSGTDDPIEEN